MTDKAPSGLHMKYFVLKPAGDSNYAIASRRALQAYAKWIADENPDMASELLRWAHTEHGNSQMRRALPDGSIASPQESEDG